MRLVRPTELPTTVDDWSGAWSLPAILALPRVLGPSAAAIAAAALGHAVGDVALVFAALLAGLVIADRRPAWQHLLPLMGRLVRLAGPALGLTLLLLLRATDVQTTIPPADALWLTGISMTVWWFAGRIVRRLVHGDRHLRLAVIGPARAADSLQRELQLAGLHGYKVAGRIALDGADEPGEVQVLGRLDQLSDAVARHRIDLLLMTSAAPRMAVFEKVAQSCLHLPVRLRELSSFYEEAFGHVAVAEINAAWFQYIVHPKYRHEQALSSRLLEIVVAAVLGLASLPVFLLLALLIKRDGGPVLFRQVRIGERGEPFTIFKLRTMSVGAGGDWSGARDPRVTTIGRFLRRTHLDELPQFLNVLRGEMCLVGPRPEQPEFVDYLEQIIPFYQRRHLIKPGLTGWAQIRCGYAGSDVGSAWKLCHDLYYLKHRSFWTNLVILGETLRTLVADPQYTAEPTSVDFILGPVELPVEAVAPATA